MSVSVIESVMNIYSGSPQWQLIVGTEGSYVLRDWLPQAQVDALLRMIDQGVAQGFDLHHTAFVEATCDSTGSTSDENNAVSECREGEEEEEKFDDPPIISDSRVWIPQLALTSTSRACMIKSFVVWNHVNTDKNAVAQMLRDIAQRLNVMLNDTAEEKGQCHAQIRDSESSSNYVTVRHLVNRQRIDKTHLDPQMGCHSPMCLLALGGQRTLWLWVWGMDLDEPGYEIPLTHGCLVVLTPDLLANGCSYSVRLPKKEGTHRGGCTSHPPHTPHALLEIRAVERHCQVDTSTTQ
jgi:hypothetical protein